MLSVDKKLARGVDGKGHCSEDGSTVTGSPTVGAKTGSPMVLTGSCAISSSLALLLCSSFIIRSIGEESKTVALDLLAPLGGAGQTPLEQEEEDVAPAVAAAAATAAAAVRPRAKMICDIFLTATEVATTVGCRADAIM